MGFPNGLLYLLPPALSHEVVEFALHAIKGIAKRHANIFVMHPVHHEFMTRQSVVNVNAASHDVDGEQCPLEKMLTRTALKHW